MIWATLVFFTLGAIGIQCGVWRKVTTWREFHHFYLAVVLLAVGIVLHQGWLVAVAAFIAFDDGVEHFVASIADDPTEGWSPIYSYVLPTLFTIPGVPALARWLDKLCGKPQPVPAPPVSIPLPPRPPAA